MDRKKLFLVLLMLAGLFSVSAFAGTGGSEIESWYTDISGSLKGTWGKLIAVGFIGIAIILFKGGNIVGGIFMVTLGLSIGIIPDMVDAKYTALAMETQVSSWTDSVSKLFQ